MGRKKLIEILGFLALLHFTAVAWAAPVPDEVPPIHSVNANASSPITSIGSNLNPAESLIASTNEVVPLSGSGAAGNMLQFKAGGHVLGFQPNKAFLAGLDHALSIEFLGTPGVIPTSASTATAMGNMTKAPALNTVHYQNLWDDISLTYESTKDGITESTYHVAPGGDVSKIRLRYNVPVEPQADGSLKFKFESGNLIESSPVAWQEIGEKHVPVQVAFRISDGEVGFSVGQYDHEYPLIIDPTYFWNTFYGSSNNDYAYGIAVDSSGNVYVTGYSSATWGSPLHPYSSDTDIFVLKLDSNGTYKWHTFYGSSSTDYGYGIAVDGNGNVYVTGKSSVTWGSPLHAFSSSGVSYDIFVLKLDSNGTYKWHTFYGPNNDNDACSIAVDGNGNVYVTGDSLASWGSPLHPFDGIPGTYHAFVLKLDSNGTYKWHTFYGSYPSDDRARSIAVDGSGNVYVMGYSSATWGSPLHAFTSGISPPFNTSTFDVFVLKLDSNGTYKWHTFYGSNNYDVGFGIAVDGSGNVYVTGNSSATWGFPLHPYSSNTDIFVLKLDSNGTYKWHTFYGSNNYDVGFGIAVDGSGNVYVTGYSSATWGSPLHPYSSNTDIFVLKLDSNGTYKWHTFYGSSSTDYGYGIAVDGSGNLYVTGYSSATWSSPLHPYSSNTDVFVFKMNESSGDLIISSIAGTGGTISPSGAVSVAYGAGQTFTITPDTGYKVAEVLVDGTPVMIPATGGTYPFSNVTANHNISVKFTTGTLITGYISPLSGPPGTTFVLWGTGFTSNSTAILHFKKPDGSMYPTQQQPIDATGHFEINNPTPYDKPSGTYTWWAVDGVTGLSSNSVVYEIIPSTGALAGFSFSDISSPKTLNAPFTVTISAMNQSGSVLTEFNQTVQLKSDFGDNTVDPISIPLVGGQWTGPVKLVVSGNNLRLEACYNGVIGRSNSFSVSGGAVATGGIGGRFVDQYGNLIDGQVWISIYSDDSQQDCKDCNGRYKFSNLKPGTYFIEATHESTGVTASVKVSIPAGLPIFRDLVFNVCSANDKYPVLLLPGIMGSADVNNGLTVYPGMPATQGEDGSKLQIHNPGLMDTCGWNSLIGKLEEAGYKKGCNLFEVPYDWRMDINKIVNTYLIPALNDAKKKTVKDKVLIIAHSMGGLVARAYIQGDSYKQDVYRLAMVGTPHKGSSTAYYMWEGGDPLLADNIVNSGINFYSNTTQKNCEITLGYKPPDWQVGYIHAYYHGEKGKDAITGLKQLLPTYGFLGHDAKKTLQIETNTFLYDLNEGKYANNKNRMKKPDNGGDGIPTVMFAGESKNTIDTISVGTPNDFYVDGGPIPTGKKESAHLTTGGDGTVWRLESAYLPVKEGWAEGRLKTGVHSELIKVFADELKTFIDTGVVPAEQTSTVDVAVAAEDQKMLSVAIRGDVRPYLVDPNGLASGIDPATSDRADAIPGTEMILMAGGGSIAITNPRDGQFHLFLTAASATDFSLELSHSDTASFYNLMRTGFNPGQTREIIFNLNATNPERITVVNLPLAPKGLKADPSGGQQTTTILSWEPVVGGAIAVTGYNIYSKTITEPRFSLVGTTASTSFDTGQTWAGTDDIATRIYNVTAVTAGGVESFFSDSAANIDRDHDGVSDAQEIVDGTNPAMFDTDQDGLSDGQEHIYGTNPLLKDTDGDGFSDYAEILGGSDPLDRNSIPSKGDINGDGSVDLKDAVLALQILAGVQPESSFNPAADVNGDGKIGMAEAIYAIRKVAGF